ncbi:putative PurR-regulated permease PerM [Dysgonomonas sp. PH5-45]|uniref:AI-2E family transporter n=1 Tax=unclassified Dysgonomonas TaxID=2630389 RepID=UPI002475C1BA|nr:MULTISPECIES: AI-2E family transporter [unclassified Dysgonomonas]MDH6355693.1 putative PurR-regulated permease PerM [Dysgonomonas sp. PH5-45]MDH6388590.1 putative PurR-regulated permease PerM [Dysgonomonas sp. PH5-37]
MSNRFDRPFTFDRVVRLLISTLLFGFAIYMIYVLSSVLLPFLVAWLIAYLMNPLVRFFQRKLHLKNRLAAVTLTFFLVVCILTGAGFLITPMIEKEIIQINDLIASYQLQTITIDGIPMSVHDFLVEHVDFNRIKEALSKEQASETLKYLLPAVQEFLSSSISFILGFTVVFIVLLYLIFILLDYDKINLLWRELIPPKHRPFVNKLALDVEKSMNTYFRHQALICVIVGILFAICFQIIGLPLAILMGVIIAVLHMVPYMHALSLLPAVLLCWLRVSQTGESFWPYVGIVVLIYIGIQCIIDLILIPKIMGRAMGMNPAIILLSLSIWGSLLGIVGMIIAIPTTTLLISYYQQFINKMDDDSAEKLVEKMEEETQKE